jgi:hypothetical protein
MFDVHKRFQSTAEPFWPETYPTVSQVTTEIRCYVKALDTIVFGCSKVKVKIKMTIFFVP